MFDYLQNKDNKSYSRSQQPQSVHLEAAATPYEKEPSRLQPNGQPRNAMNTNANSKMSSYQSQSQTRPDIYQNQNLSNPDSRMPGVSPDGRVLYLDRGDEPRSPNQQNRDNSFPQHQSQNVQQRRISPSQGPQPQVATNRPNQRPRAPTDPQSPISPTGYSNQRSRAMSEQRAPGADQTRSPRQKNDERSFRPIESPEHDNGGLPMYDKLGPQYMPGQDYQGLSFAPHTQERKTSPASDQQRPRIPSNGPLPQSQEYRRQQSGGNQKQALPVYPENGYQRSRSSSNDRSLQNSRQPNPGYNQQRSREQSPGRALDNNHRNMQYSTNQSQSQGSHHFRGPSPGQKPHDNNFQPSRSRAQSEIQTTDLDDEYDERVRIPSSSTVV